MPLCPRCSHRLTDDELFDLVTTLIRQRAAKCDHVNMEPIEGDPTHEICNDCGMVKETSRPI